MSNLKTCPACNGQGFIVKLDNDQTPPVHHRCECVRCGGSGSVKSIGMSPEESVAELARAFDLDIVIPVRCKACVYWMPMEKNQGHCKHWAGLFRMSFEHEYCCCGKEKHEENS